MEWWVVTEAHRRLRWTPVIPVVVEGIEDTGVWVVAPVVQNLTAGVSIFRPLPRDIT